MLSENFLITIGRGLRADNLADRTIVWYYWRVVKKSQGSYRVPIVAPARTQILMTISGTRLQTRGRGSYVNSCDPSWGHVITSIYPGA